MAKGKFTKIGAAWKKKSGDGRSYLSISIEVAKVNEASTAIGGADKLNVSMFENRNKKSEKHPDYDFVVRIGDADVSQGGGNPDDLPF